MVRNFVRLKRRAQKAGVPVIYVNDNFGRWKSDFRRTVDHCARHGRGCDVVKLLRPEKSDYFVLKPKQSGFFSTTLETVLRPKFQLCKIVNPCGITTVRLNVLKKLGK